MKYDYSESLQVLAEDVSRRLFPYISTSGIKCFRSVGSNSKDNVIARAHSLSKIIQKAMSAKPLYVFEFIRENFDKLSTEDKVKSVIHQLMFISKNFDGDFNKDSINLEDVNSAYEAYLDCRKKELKIDWFKDKKDKK